MCFESFLVYINNEAGRHWSMEKEIREFVIYLHDVKKTSENELGLYMLGVKEDSKEQIGGAYCE